MPSSSLRRLALLTLATVVSVSLADKSPAADGATVADTRSADNSATPQTRFLPGIGKVINNIFNSCSRCGSNDPQFANRCCQSGERQCCFAFQSGFGGGFGPGFGGGFGPGFSNPGFSQPGFGGGFGGQSGFGGRPGFGGNFGGGFGHPGFPGQFGQSGFGFHSNIKPGFCPKQGFFGPKTRSGADATPGLRSAAPAGVDATPTEDGRVKRSEQGPAQVQFSTESSIDGPPAADEDRAASAQEARANRRVRQATVDAPRVDSGAGNNNPNTRFLPNPFGPGSLIPNPFCKDECFNDIDCPGHLKCCLRDCRKCQKPSFF
ncbi:WAP-type 'four-disulfide core' domain [Trinorchestia longiramus]|nr:WAP-type 'four-disulfide core' domain [Trinorchestia longiramus]